MKKPWWKRRKKNLPLWGILLTWLIMSTGAAVCFWCIVRNDKAVAPQEKVVLGTIDKVSHGKTDNAHYSFTYAGKEYHGSEIVRPDLSPGDAVVYFDPAHPSTNSLVEFQRKSEQDRSMMKFCTYVAIGLAAALALTLRLKWKRKKDSLEDQVSLLSNR